MTSSRTLWQQRILLFSLFLFAACGISYELILATISSYLFGDSVYHFSLTIGLFMSAMGIGAWLSRRLEHHLLERFLWFEWALAVLGGLAPTLLLFIGVIYGDSIYTPLMLLSILGIGGLVGIELPLLTRIYNENQDSLNLTLSNVLTADYIGSLLGSLLLPLVLLPKMGLVAAGMALGVINAMAALLTLLAFRNEPIRIRTLQFATLALLTLLSVGIFRTQKLESWFSYHAFRDHVRLKQRSPYQEIVLTQGRSRSPLELRKQKQHKLRSKQKQGAKQRSHRTSWFLPPKEKPARSYLPRRWKDDIRLYLNGNLQFSSIDEYRYHEVLIHIAMSRTPQPRRILVLGGGDGLALRELLKYKTVQQVVLVDLDPAVVKIFRTHPKLRALHKRAFSDPRVQVHAKDAFHYIRYEAQPFDLIVIDLPDPHTLTLARLYSSDFYKLVKRRLTPNGAVVTQSTSPFFGRRAFWCIHKTMKASGLHVRPYHVHVHSFGEWGFQIGTRKPFQPETLKLRIPTRYLTNALIPSLFTFPKDIAYTPVKSNTMLHPILFHYYQKDAWIGYQ